MPDLREAMRVFPRLGDYPGLTLKASINSVLCFGYKVLGERHTHCLNAWDYKPWSKDINDDSALCRAIYDVLNDADVIATHNGSRFDLKFLQTRFLKHNIPSLHKVIHIDTCKLAKKHLLLFNNKLDTLAKFMTKERKLENSGWDLWHRVMQRHEPSMALMSKYCKQDVVTLEAVFKRLRPFISSLPNYNMSREMKDHVCPNCGSTRLRGNGTYARKNHIQKRFLCKDCGSSCSVRAEKEPQAI